MDRSRERRSPCAGSICRGDDATGPAWPVSHIQSCWLPISDLCLERQHVARTATDKRRVHCRAVHALFTGGGGRGPTSAMRCAAVEP
jgi:hypothetical protein